MTWRRTWAVVAMLALTGVIGTGVLTFVLDRQNYNRALIRENENAIRVSCLVLTRAIVQSGAGGTTRPRRTELSRAVQRLTVLRQRALLRAMTPAEAVEAKALAAFIERAGGAVPLPDCDELAADPRKFEREYAQEARP